MQPSQETPADVDEVSLKELCRILWSGWLPILCATFVGGAGALGASFLVTKTYDASIVISPVASTNGTGLGGGALGALGSQLGSLAALAGLSVGTDSKTAESIAVLQSQDLTEAYIEKNNLMPELFHQKWDAQRKAWKTQSPKDMPTLWKANQFFAKRVREVASDSKTGLLTLTISWRDPHLAADWANGLVATTNAFLRQKAITESERNIAYLYAEAAKTNVVEARQAIYAVLETEINRQMLARGTQEYAFRVLDPAKAPEKAAYPQKIVWGLMGTVAGMLLSALAVLVRFAWKGEDPPVT